MFWKTKVPADWKVGDRLEGNIFVDFEIVYIISISPSRKNMVVEGNRGRLYKVTSTNFHNASLQNRRLKEEMKDWEDYNKALKELQDKFGL